MDPLFALTNTLRVVNGVFTIALTIAGIVWVIVRWIKKSDEPLSLIVKLAVSLPIIGAILYFAITSNDAGSMIAAVMVGMVGGLFLAMLWGQNIVATIAAPFENLYTGGSTASEPQAFYSIAHSKRKRGMPEQAIAEIHGQLAKFPGDFAGEMLLAEIFADDLKDFSSAEEVVLRTIQHEKRSPQNVSYALNRLADWHLRFHQDRDGARGCLEKIIEMLPDTEQSLVAAQRIAHLTPAEMLAEQLHRTPIAVKKYDQKVGLLGKVAEVEAPAIDPVEAAQHYVKHLEVHPHDNEAREQLAQIYADHYQRLDLAVDQLEQMIATPGHPPKLVVRWLNMIADLQLKLKGDIDAARVALQRIITLYPGNAAATTAQNRINHLKLEGRSKQLGSSVKLGTYAQNIGLSGNVPKSTP